MTEFEFQIDNFMLYCTSRNLAKKTLASYEQTLKLFRLFLKETFGIEMHVKYNQAISDNIFAICRREVNIPLLLASKPKTKISLNGDRIIKSKYQQQP